MYEMVRSVGLYHPRLNMRVDEGELYHIQGLDIMRSLPSLWNDLVALRALEDLNLGIYRLGDEHLIGFQSDTVHPHDRWLLRAPFKKENWTAIPAEGFPGPGSPVSDLRQALETLQNIRKHIMLGVAPRTADRAGRSLEFAVALGMPSRTTGQLIKYVDLVPKNIDGNLLHALLHHYPQLQARDPHFRDMPRNLALRMHGLGPMLDAGYPLPES